MCEQKIKQNCDVIPSGRIHHLINVPAHVRQFLPPTSRDQACERHGAIQSPHSRTPTGCLGPPASTSRSSLANVPAPCMLCGATTTTYHILAPIVPFLPRTSVNFLLKRVASRRKRSMAWINLHTPAPEHDVLGALMRSAEHNAVVARTDVKNPCRHTHHLLWETKVRLHLTTHVPEPRV